MADADTDARHASWLRRHRRLGRRELLTLRRIQLLGHATVWPGETRVIHGPGGKSHLFISATTARLLEENGHVDVVGGIVTPRREK